MEMPLTAFKDPNCTMFAQVWYSVHVRHECLAREMYNSIPYNRTDVAIARWQWPWLTGNVVGAPHEMKQYDSNWYFWQRPISWIVGEKSYIPPKDLPEATSLNKGP